MTSQPWDQQARQTLRQARALLASAPLGWLAALCGPRAAPASALDRLIRQSLAAGAALRDEAPAAARPASRDRTRRDATADPRALWPTAFDAPAPSSSSPGSPSAGGPHRSLAQRRQARPLAMSAAPSGPDGQADGQATPAVWAAGSAQPSRAAEANAAVSADTAPNAAQAAPALHSAVRPLRPLRTVSSGLRPAMSTGEVQGDGADTARVQAEFTALTKASPPNLKPAHRRLVNAEDPTPAALGAQFRARAAVHTAAVHTAVDAALDAALDTAVQPAVQPAPASASAGAAPPARWLGAMGDLAAPGSAGAAAQRGAAVLVSAHASATAPTRLVSDMTALQGLLQSAVADSHRRHGLAATAAPAAPAVPAASAPSLPAATGLRAWPAIDPLTEDMLVDRLADLLQDRLREQALRHLGFTGGLA